MLLEGHFFREGLFALRAFEFIGRHTLTPLVELHRLAHRLPTQSKTNRGDPGKRAKPTIREGF